MRRLLIPVCAVVLVDMMLYSVLTPILPEIVDELDLRKGAAGMLVAAYAAGSFLGAIPAALLSTRRGPKAAVLLGLALLVTACVVFAVADSLWMLIAARFVQGISSSVSWTGAIAWLLAAAPRHRRGELLGVALGTGIFGAVFGPVLGSLAALTSRELVFFAVAALALAVGLFAARVGAVHLHEAAPGALRRALKSPVFLAGLGLMLLPALLLGVVLVLGPLHLSDRGWGAAAIGGVWLLNAGVQAAATPLLGRWTDREGAARPVALLLVLGAATSTALAVIGTPFVYAAALVAASTVYGALYAPAFSLIARGADENGLPQGVAFALMNGSWAIGAVIGPAAGGAVAEAAGDRLPLAAAAVVCVATLAYVATRIRSASTVTT